MHMHLLNDHSTRHSTVTTRVRCRRDSAPNVHVTALLFDFTHPIPIHAPQHQALPRVRALRPRARRTARTRGARGGAPRVPRVRRALCAGPVRARRGRCATGACGVSLPFAFVCAGTGGGVSTAFGGAWEWKRKGGGARGGGGAGRRRARVAGAADTDGADADAGIWGERVGEREREWDGQTELRVMTRLEVGGAKLAARWWAGMSTRT
ncbi:hypothetical protein B0H10DRAFT_488239 [Mycena sp. CBHHK59/15]|nr:hypothetical protein B0H10DRAFT_488239 [Mycena sp. CBHHK59/15]